MDPAEECNVNFIGNLYRMGAYAVPINLHTHAHIVVNARLTQGDIGIKLQTGAVVGEIFFDAFVSKFKGYHVVYMRKLGD